jgi:hypothetical protein
VKYDVRYTCTECDRVEDRARVNPAVGTDDESARISGWRIGTTQGGKRQIICPECAGTDEEYWDRQTLNVAYMAGIDAGNLAWGGGA